MNVFYLPSWYPSASNPLYGIFNYEQVRMVAHHNPEGRMGVAVWGQGDDPYLLWSGQPVRSLRKWIATSCEPSEVHEGNIRTYFSPQFIWTRKVRAGNLPAIIRAVEQSFLRFRQEVGEIQIMHVMSAYPGALIAGYLASKYSVPFVTTVHMSPFPFSEFLDKKGRMRPFLAKPLAGSARLLAVSRASERQIRSHGFTKVDTLVNPVDDRFFSRVKNTRTAKMTRLIAIGRCVPQKGFDVLLSAFARLKDPALSLTLIGSGSGLPMLQKQAEALSISGQVCFLGNVSRDEIVNQLHGHDLFVMSSRHESYGLVVAEAQACGLPVVSTRCGGPEDILTDQTGIFCEPDDPDVLASAIRKAMGRRWDTQWIREHARSRFSSSAFTEQLFSIYRSVLK